MVSRSAAGIAPHGLPGTARSSGPTALPNPRRVRVSVAGTRRTDIYTAPYICIEVLSPKDPFPKLQDRFDDYLAMGVPNIWVLDPPSRRGWSIVREGHLEALDGVLRTSDGRVALAIADLFQIEG